ncbi:MAG: DUF3662 and FHA domain-containing protein [Candidatus Promineifilaceae bacterium]
MKNNRLSNFENIAQDLVEGSFRRLFADQVLPSDLANKLARAMEDSARDGIAADLYEVGLHPDDLAVVNEEGSALTEQLANYLLRLSRQAGLVIPGMPAIRFVSDLSVRRRRMAIRATFSASPSEVTRARKFNREQMKVHPLNEVDAYLIIDGKRHIALNQPLVTIGRRIDNDIVIDVPAISRRHAQIRWRYGRFVVYDLGSRGGTKVNGERVTESVLHNGDVIALSDVPLIYGEGLEEDEQERPRPSSASENTLVYGREE